MKIEMFDQYLLQENWNISSIFVAKKQCLLLKWKDLDFSLTFIFILALRLPGWFPGLLLPTWHPYHILIRNTLSKQPHILLTNNITGKISKTPCIFQLLSHFACLPLFSKLYDLNAKVPPWKKPDYSPRRRTEGKTNSPLMCFKIKPDMPHKIIDSSFWLIKLELLFFKELRPGQKSGRLIIVLLNWCYIWGAWIKLTKLWTGLCLPSFGKLCLVYTWGSMKTAKQLASELGNVSE